MARKRTGSAGGKGASPQDETVESAPRGYSIYSEKAEQAAAGAAGAGTSAPVSAAEPLVDSPARPVFAEEEIPAPMTPEEARREAAEDAEILPGVEDPVAPETEPEPAPGVEAASPAPAEPAAESPAPPETVTPDTVTPDTATPGSSSDWKRDDREMPETVAARPAPTPRAEPASAPAPTPAQPERSGGIAGKLLGALLLLLIGAGLALWLGPRVAPSLPAPVAKYFEPGGPGAQERLASLDAELTALRGEVENRPAGVSAQDLDGAISSAKSALEGEITQLRDQMGAGTDMAERLARVESAAQGAQAELDTLKGQIAGATNAAQPELDVYKGEIDGLRAEMGSLSDQVAALRSRVDEVGAEAKRQIDTAQATVESVQTEAAEKVDSAARQADVAAVGAALAAGQPFADPLARLASMPDAAIPADLSEAAASGVPTLAQLRDAFPKAAHEAIRASIVAGAGDGIADRALAMFRAQFATRSLSPREGAAPDAVLSRMGAMLDHDDLSGALRESQALPSEAQAAMGDWLAKAKLRDGAAQALGELQSATPATN